MLYGVSYYPEHKTKQELDHDIQLIIESGINTVRMAEFAWCRLEPSPGEYHFEWLDSVVTILGEKGIKTIICTPTACPPAWMIAKHPDILYTDNRGITRPFGGRRHYCYNNETYREYSRQIAEAMGKHYGDNPYVVGFQIDNELAQEGTGRCCCETCNEKFSLYLENKYKTIDAFNKRSGGIFWSQEYTDFRQINPPVNTIEVGAQQQIRAFHENPTVRLEFERFSSDSQIEYQDIQTVALKKHTKQPVTTNGTGLATNSIDYYKSTQMLDNYAFDYYPGLRDTSVDSFPYAFARGVKSGKAFWIMEFMSGGGHRFGGSGRVQPNPGALKQSVVQSYAHGADMMMHFQFRSFPIGAEQLNYAIVDLDGIPRRRYYEMQDTAALLKKLSAYKEASFENEVAICMDYDTHWALKIKPVNDPIFKYLDFCGKFYHELLDLGINSDVIPLTEDFSKYKVLILPSAFILEEKYREKLKAYVSQGGILIGTFLTSVKNKDSVGYTETLPAGLTDLFGVHVEEVEPVFETNIMDLKMKLNNQETAYQDGSWSELLSGPAEMIGTYTEGYKTGQGVIASHQYGKGIAYYMGTELPEEGLKNLLETICKENKIKKHPFNPIQGVEVVRRSLDGKELYYLFNFTQKDQEISFQDELIDCVEDKVCKDQIVLEPNGIAVLKQK